MKPVYWVLGAMALLVGACASPSSGVKNQTVTSANAPTPAIQRVSATRADVDPQRLQLATRYVSAMLSANSIEEASASKVDETVDELRRKHPNISDEKFDRLRELLRPKFTEIIEKTVDVLAVPYAERFTVSELQNLVQFQTSPVGQKLARLSDELKEERDRVLKEAVPGIAAQTIAPVILLWMLEVGAITA